MFFWRMIFRALRRQMSKRLLVAVTIFLGASLTTSMFAVMLDVGDKIKQELGSYGANIQVLPKGAAVISDMYDVDTDQAQGALREDELPKLKTIFWAYNIEDFAPFLETHANVGGEDMKVQGTWFHNTIDLPTGEDVTTGLQGMRDWWQVEGQWASDSGEAMVGSSVAKKNGWSVGDQIEISSDKGTSSLKVAGIYTAGSDEDRTMYIPLAEAQKLSDRPGQVGKIEVRALTTPDNELASRAARDPSTLSLEEWETWYCTAYVSSISYQIEEVMTNADAKAVRQIADTEGVILDKTQMIMTMVAGFAMIAAALGIANLVTASVMERSKEIGLMKALGARNGSIIGLILTETLVVGLIGGGLGFFAGVGLAQLVGHLVFGSAITIRPVVAPLMALIILLTVVIGCIPSIHSMLKLTPTQVLHGR
ncbi:ABC transporter permease [Propionimicrobium lymphophilum]|uniref:ABC transporter permease n=1 Tax=Propionimicrobium lymphophilum TaxID=33012 RepID=UPI0025516F67|nr:ABC transporter permease [Propionimicrobium lymphophilum]MDK7710444.1 ABC transporter permease [Propionimicrobium lymphophilum]MDK7733706.1 ABC transporter permease [Propionimicrobium lymphophilum]